MMNLVYLKRINQICKKINVEINLMITKIKIGLDINYSN